MDRKLAVSVPDYVRSLASYVPGRRVEEMPPHATVGRVIQLASNENPFGPSPSAIQVLGSALEELHRYPDGSASGLKRALSSHLAVSPQSLLVGNGSNELIEILVRTFCVPGDAVLMSRITFLAYRLCAQAHGVHTVETDVDEFLQADVDALIERAKEDERIRIIFLANPDNPTGAYIKDKQLRTLLSEIAAIRGGSILVVLDYAYWEYVVADDISDPIQLQKKFPNVVILRTFSKIYGLAGLRVGYAVADPEVIEVLNKIRQPFNVNALALLAAEAALTDKEFVSNCCDKNRIEMERWAKALQEMGVPYWPSQGNFILADVAGGLNRSGSEIYASCLKKGVIFCPLANYGLPGLLRITMGTQPENLEAIEVLEEERC